MRQWHWISAAVSLIGMLLFAATGITLNHAGQIEASPKIVARNAQLPASLIDQLKVNRPASPASLPEPIQQWIRDAISVSIGNRVGEWSASEVYVALPRPGGDSWLSIDLENGNVSYEQTDRGWISYLNDLHKGRNTGAAWSWFLDIFAGACVVFCLTGLVLLQLMAGSRSSTWPLVGAGLMIPALLAIFFIH